MERCASFPLSRAPRCVSVPSREPYCACFPILVQSSSPWEGNASHLAGGFPVRRRPPPTAAILGSSAAGTPIVPAVALVAVAVSAAVMPADPSYSPRLLQKDTTIFVDVADVDVQDAADVVDGPF